MKRKNLLVLFLFYFFVMLFLEKIIMKPDWNILVLKIMKMQKSIFKKLMMRKILSGQHTILDLFMMIYITISIYLKNILKLLLI